MFTRKCWQFMKSNINEINKNRHGVSSYVKIKRLDVPPQLRQQKMLFHEAWLLLRIIKVKKYIIYQNVIQWGFLLKVELKIEKNAR